MTDIVNFYANHLSKAFASLFPASAHSTLVHLPGIFTTFTLFTSGSCLSYSKLDVDLLASAAEMQ
jgi:hypothetical protein